MNTRRIFGPTRFLLLLLAGMLLAAGGVRAQSNPPSDDNGNYNGPDDQNYDTGQDPPSRVARLSYVDGTVSFQPGGQGEWGQAVRNRPITIGDKLWSDNNSRAELQAGQASIRLSSMTALSFLNLDDQTTQMRLAEGTINFRIRELREGDVYEVDTPNVAFNVTQAGAFRVDVNENGDGTRITAIRGEGQVTANGETYTIHAGERGEFNGADNVTYFVSAAPEPDGFDRWANDRDLKEDNSLSARYVSRDVPGYSDLDENGTWNEEPDYGPVWYPTVVDVGWAPYSYGYWNYVGPWGWTWVDYSPWGFAPFHYGRWAYIGSRWGWCPGPYYASPIYGPAFVGFIGGSHWGVGFGSGFGGGIGWFPLGPREPFHPWYHTSGRYYRNVNINNTHIQNTTIINNRTNNFNYAYAHNTRAVTVTSHNNFVNGQRINRGDFHVTEASLRGAQVTNRADATPTRQSYFGGNGLHGNIARPSAAVQNRQVLARSTPAPGASHMPVRTIGGANAGGRGGFNNGNARGNADAARGPVMGRAAQTGAAANNNRPSFSRDGKSPQAGGRPNMPGNQAPGNQGMSGRQRELSTDKPQSHMRNAPADSGRGQDSFGQGNRNSTRNWSAQGNSTDRGRAPSGFGANPPRNNVPRGTAMTRADRPSWAGSGNNPGYSVNPRSSSPSNRRNDAIGNARSYSPPQRSSAYPGNRPAYNSDSSRGAPPQRSYSPQQRSYSPPQRSYSAPSQQSRSYSPPQRSYNPPQRSYSPPQRSYSAPSQPRSYSAPSRSYSAPSRSYSAPSRSYSAPSHSYSAPSHSSGGGAPRSGGGGNAGAPRGGGGNHGGGRH